MERLKETERYTTFKEGDDFVEYQRKFLIWVEKMYSETAKRVNWLLEPRYYEITNGTDKWRYAIVANGDLQVQKWDGVSAWGVSFIFKG